MKGDDDDGWTFDYESGEFTWTTLTVSRDAGGTLRGVAGDAEGAGQFGYGPIAFRMMTGR